MPDTLSWEGMPVGDLPNISKKDLKKRYVNRIDVARRYRDKEGYDKTWKRMIDLYKGDHFDKSDLANGDCIAVNLSFSTTNVIVPSVSINYPKVVVYPKRKEWELESAIAEATVNYWWKHEDIKPEFQRAVKDSIIIGHGWCKVGYRFATEERERDPEDYKDEVAQKLSEAEEAAASDPENAPNLPTPEDIEALVPPTELVPVEDRPFVERVSPFDMYVDPEGTCMGDIKWLAQKVVRPIEEVKRDSRYNARAKRDLKPDASINNKWRDEANEKRYDDDIQRVTVWEFYDLQRGTMCVFAEGSDGFLVDPIDMPYHYGQPFYMLRNYDVPDCFYPIGDLEQIESVQRELNATRSQMMNARKRDKRKHLARRTYLSPEAKAALESDVDGEIVFVEDDNVALDQIIVPLAQNSVSPEMYRHSEVVEKDLESISGVSDYARGAVPETNRTATEASIIQDALNSRSADKLSRVEEAVKHIAAMLVQLAQQYVSQQQMIPLVGPEGAMRWIEFNPGDIKGEFLFDVEAGSTQPKNETFRRQQAMQMMQALQPFLMTGMVNVPTLLEHVLREGFDVKDPQKFLFAMPPMAPGAPPVDPEGGENAEGTPKEDPTKEPKDKRRSSEGLSAQLQGQVGLDPGFNGGGAQGPGAA